MAALEVIRSNLIEAANAPLMGDMGGTSKGDPGAGTSTGSGDLTSLLPPRTRIHTASKGVPFDSQ